MTRTTATPSKYIAHIGDPKPGPVALYLRVSGRGQNDHLSGQEQGLLWELEKRGFIVAAIFRETVSGWAEYRTGLERAALTAKQGGAVLVAESGSRFIRGMEGQYVVPRVFEFERLMRLVDGARLVTLHHPDTHWKKERGHQSKRGQIAADNRGGRQVARGPGWKTPEGIKNAGSVEVAPEGPELPENWENLGRPLEHRQGLDSAGKQAVKTT